MAHATQEQILNPAEQAETSVAWGVCAALALALLAFAHGYSGGPSASQPPAVSEPTPSSPREVEGSKGAVATAHPEASKAALEVLRSGGNAFDALVAASFVISVVEPQSTGLGGGGFVVYHDAQAGQQGAIDGREVAPQGATRDMYVQDGEVIEGYRVGPLSAGVPGLVGMLHHTYRMKGSGVLSWAQLVEPARKLAEFGCVVTPHLAKAIEVHQKDLERYPTSQAVFLPEGKPLEAGATLVQNDLAHTLSVIAEKGAAGFYTGPIAKELAQASVDFGGMLKMSDLASYAPKDREAVRGTYRGVTVISMPPPSSGGVHLVQMLNILSHHDLAGMGFQSTEHLHLLTEAMRRAFADRAAFMADADKADVPVAKLLDPAYGAALSKDIDLHKATPSDEVRPGALFVKESEHTTHISIIDAWGNAVASTQTINTGLGSCFVAGTTGVLLNNEMADFTADVSKPNPFGLPQSEKNLPEPGKRPLSSMTPTVLLDAKGNVLAALGSPGGPKIITTTLQTLSNIVDFEQGALESVANPRIHHQWKHNGEDKLFVERGVSGGGGLGALGHRVARVPYGSLGNAQIVLVRPDGTRVAASDPRYFGRPGAYSVSLADELAAKEAAKEATKKKAQPVLPEHEHGH